MRTHFGGHTEASILKSGKAIKKIMEDLEKGNLVEPTHSNWVAQRVEHLTRLVADYITEGWTLNKNKCTYQE